MAKTLQFRRGTTAELASVTGAEAELFVDTTKDTVVVMDGSTAGGTALATEAFVLANAGSGGSVGGDAVFDSALIGDVSIISNEITGVDSYGNNAVLTLSGETVNISPSVDTPTTVTTTHPKVYDPNALGGMGGYTYGNVSTGMTGSGYYVQIAGATNQAFFDAILALPVGAQIVIHGDMSGVITVTLSAKFTAGAGYGLGSLTASIVESNFNIDESVSQIDSVVTTHSAQSASYSFAANGTLGVNQDLTILSTGNTTISANSTVVTTTPVTIDQMGAPALAWFYDTISGKSYFGFLSMSAGQYAQYFKAGMTVNCFTSAGGMKDSPLTLTLKTDMAYSNISAGSYLSETNEVAVNNGMSTYIYTASDISTTASSGSIANYTFDTTGAFTAQSLLATDALIGDVSIVGNTIAGVDSYGLADTLVVDGNLQVANTAASTASYTNGSQWDGSINWFSGVLQWSYPSIGMSLMQSLKAGDKLTFEDQMNVGTFVTVTLTSAFAYNMGYMAYIASVAEFNSGMTIGAAAGTISIASLVTKTSTFNDTGLTVDGNLEVTGTLQLPVTPDVPVTPGTVVTWAKINIGGQVYFTPLYQ